MIRCGGFRREGSGGSFKELLVLTRLNLVLRHRKLRMTPLLRRRTTFLFARRRWRRRLRSGKRLFVTVKFMTR